MPPAGDPDNLTSGMDCGESPPILKHYKGRWKEVGGTPGNVLIYNGRITSGSYWVEHRWGTPILEQVTNISHQHSASEAYDALSELASQHGCDLVAIYL